MLSTKLGVVIFEFRTFVSGDPDDVACLRRVTTLEALSWVASCEVLDWLSYSSSIGLAISLFFRRGIVSFGGVISSLVGCMMIIAHEDVESFPFP